MGPVGVGKSSLLRAITGLLGSNPSVRTWGSVEYKGKELFQTKHHHPAIVAQNIRLMTASVLENIVDGLPERSTLTRLQQEDLTKRLLIEAGLEHLCTKLNTTVTDLSFIDIRMLAIVRQIAPNPKLLCIDEPTAGFSHEESARIVNYLKKESKKRALLVVTHNQLIAKALNGVTALLAGGWIQESQAANDFFNAPITEVAKQFIETGSCSLPSPNTPLEELDPEWRNTIRALPEKATEFKSDTLGPNNFLWLKQGKLAGTPRPGLIADLEDDLTLLKQVGVTHLVSLTKTPLDIQECNKKRISVFASPIIDMQPPKLQQALEICLHIEEKMDNGHVVAVHCKAGLGRTGTLLAAQLIFEGTSTLVALEKVRSIEIRYVQTESQIKFLERFEKFLPKVLNSNNTGDARIIA